MLTPISDVRLKPQKANNFSLDQLQPFQAGMTFFANNDVVMHSDAERLGDLQNRMRHLDVRAARRGVARRMVVHEPTRAGSGR